jgi:hypothetical protein
MSRVRYHRTIWLLAALLLLVGCEPPRPPRVTLDLEGVEPAVGYAELATVLDRTVGDDGYVYIKLMCERIESAEEGADGAGLPDLTASACTLRDALNAQVKRLAVAGPTATPRLFPTRADRLTYWYNARSAWALRLLLEAWDRQQTARARGMVPWPLSEALSRPLPVDGGMMTLDGIDAAIARQGGPLAVMAAPGIDLRRAKLPREPFIPDQIFKELPRRLQAFIDDEERFVIDVMSQRVLVPPVIWQYRQSLIAHHQQAYDVPEVTLTTALLPLVDGSAARRLHNALGYQPVANHTPRYAIARED